MVRKNKSNISSSEKRRQRLRKSSAPLTEPPPPPPPFLYCHLSQLKARGDAKQRRKGRLSSIDKYTDLYFFIYLASRSSLPHTLIVEFFLFSSFSSSGGLRWRRDKWEAALATSGGVPLPRVMAARGVTSHHGSAPSAMDRTRRSAANQIKAKD